MMPLSWPFSSTSASMVLDVFLTFRNVFSVMPVAAGMLDTLAELDGTLWATAQVDFDGVGHAMVLMTAGRGQDWDVIADLGDPGSWCFAGDGAGPAGEMIVAAGGRVLPPERWPPRASSLIRLASVAPEWGHVADPRSWEPGYVRLPAAQRGPGVEP